MGKLCPWLWLLAALLCGASLTGCAAIDMFNSEHVHVLPDPNESGKIDALNKRVNALEHQPAAASAENNDTGGTIQ